MMMRMVMVMIIRMRFQPSEIIQVTSCNIDDVDNACKPQPQLFWIGCAVSSKVNIDEYLLIDS